MVFNNYTNSNDGLMGISVAISGRIFSDSERRFKTDKGERYWKLLYYTKGKEKFFLKDGITSDAKEGSFIFFKPYEKQHRINESSVVAESYFICFNAPDDFDLLGFESGKVYNAPLVMKVCDSFEEIIKEIQLRNPHFEKICASKLFEILSNLKRTQEPLNFEMMQYGDKIASVITLMRRKNYFENTLEEYAEICKMSKFHFLRVFKEITGESPIEYRNKIRIERAKELLHDKNLSIKEVGIKLGYNSPSYFCDAFKKKTGISPKEYKKNIK